MPYRLGIESLQVVTLSTHNGIRMAVGLVHIMARSCFDDQEDKEKEKEKEKKKAASVSNLL